MRYGIVRGQNDEKNERGGEGGGQGIGNGDGEIDTRSRRRAKSIHELEIIVTHFSFEV